MNLNWSIGPTCSTRKRWTERRTRTSWTKGWPQTSRTTGAYWWERSKRWHWRKRPQRWYRTSRPTKKDDDMGQRGEPGWKGLQGLPGPTVLPGLFTTAPTTDAPTTLMTADTPTRTPGQCGGPGWRWVKFLNMTEPRQVCSSGLSLTSYSRRTSGRATSTWLSCWSTTLVSVGGSKYSRVGSRAGAYRWGYNYMYAFYGYYGHWLDIELLVCGWSVFDS